MTKKTHNFDKNVHFFQFQLSINFSLKFNYNSISTNSNSLHFLLYIFWSECDPTFNGINSQNILHFQLYIVWSECDPTFLGINSQNALIWDQFGQKSGRHSWKCLAIFRDPWLLLAPPNTRDIEIKDTLKISSIFMWLL